MLFVFCHMNAATQGHCFSSYVQIKFASSGKDNCEEYNLTFLKVETRYISLQMLFTSK